MVSGVKKKDFYYVLMNQSGFYRIDLYSSRYDKDEANAWPFKSYANAFGTRLLGDRVLEREEERLWL